MQISIASQTWIFLGAIVLGAGLGVYYDAFRILRIAIPHAPWAVCMEDLLFFLLGGVLTACYLLVTEYGELRLFILVGETIGFILYHCTIGVVVMGAAKGVIGGLRWIGTWIWRLFFAPLIAVFKFLERNLRKMLRKATERASGSRKNCRRHLKSPLDLLYNLKKHLFTGWSRINQEGQRSSITYEGDSNKKDELDL